MHWQDWLQEQDEATRRIFWQGMRHARERGTEDFARELAAVLIERGLSPDLDGMERLVAAKKPNRRRQAEAVAEAAAREDER